MAVSAALQALAAGAQFRTSPLPTTPATRRELSELVAGDPTVLQF